MMPLRIYKNHILTIRRLCFFLLIQIQSISLAKDNLKTPLMEASLRGDYPEVQLLLESSLPSINEQSANGMTALHYALDAQQEDIALSLLAAGARYTIPDNANRYPLEIAEKQNLHFAATAIKKAIHTSTSYPYYHNFAQKTGQNTAVVVVGYNRPQLFKKVVDALSSNLESQRLPFFFILDGGPNSCQKEYTEIINASKIKKKYIIKRPFNYGCDWNIVSALKFMFDWCGFRRIVHFEDDIVVTPNYLRFILNLDEWAHTRFTNIGSVLGFGKRFTSKKEKYKHVSSVFKYAGLWLGYCMRKSVWNDIRTIVSEYEQILMTSSHPRHWVKHPSVISTYHQWISKKLNTDKKHVDFTEQTTIRPHITDANFALEKFSGGQDTVLTFALYLKGYVTLSSSVNRYLCIGKEGTTFNEKMWKNFFAGIELDYFPSDAQLTKFKLLLS